MTKQVAGDFPRPGAATATAQEALQEPGVGRWVKHLAAKYASPRIHIEVGGPALRAETTSPRPAPGAGFA